MFQRKLIACAVAGVAALGLSSVALANGGGYGAAPVAATPAPVAAAPAAQSSFYVGLGAGYGDNHWNDYYNNILYNASNGYTGTINSVKHRGFAGRVDVGYNFNQYLAAELGWTYLPKATVNSTAANGNPNSGTVKSWAADLLAKVTAPIADGFGVYAKAGAGYMRAKFSGSVENQAQGGSDDHWGPAYGVGASYDITPNFVADISWLHYSGQNNIAKSDYIPDADVGLVSLSYKFPVSM